ncbi:Acetyl-CoA carboxylase [Handroanthus impetiginosus]|uniref:Biotin carboxyl carrier protein of acetyl-CoA carboxylase n=1 Tax=Handroanthus impetiginosus TaxID=429701 RepID=A0A2G9HLU8_9LAMI|nr:Acetyl-CoA carboxylase [Handroanthus impetiginosus]
MASFSVPCPKVSFLLAASSQSAQKRHPIASFPRSDSRSNPTLTMAQSKGPGWGQSDAFKVHAQLNEAAIEETSNANPAVETVPTIKSENQNEVPDASSLSTFMTQVKDLVKLVDSQDIVELQLKQLDCEVLIRKKEAVPQPSVAAPSLFSPFPTHQAMLPPQLPPPSVPAPASVPSASSSVQAPPAPTKPKSSHPPLKCPMAGTFYRAPAPGAPPFVKVGDKVQKGQVLCIVEAMKLMNEIEADQSGTVVEVLLDDGKPVSIDTPLFIIEP